MLTHRDVESGMHWAVSNCARWSVFGPGGMPGCARFGTVGASLGWMVALAVVCSLAAGVIAWLIGQRRRLHAKLEDPREQASRALAFHAYHDTLTGLPNRAYLMRELEEALASSRDEPLAVMFIDLDGFKSINDPYYDTIDYGRWIIPAVREEWTAPTSLPFGELTVIPLRAGEKLRWRLLEEHA